MDDADSLISALALTALIIWELVTPQPVINLRLLKSRAFAISNVVMFIFGFIIVSTTQLIPQLTQQLLSYNATEAGLTLTMGGLGTLIMMPVAGLVTGRFIQPRYTVFIALCGTALALFYTSSFDLSASFNALSGARFLQALWMPFKGDRLRPFRERCNGGRSVAFGKTRAGAVRFSCCRVSLKSLRRHDGSQSETRGNPFCPAGCR